jgi:hypothetical protein
MVIADPADQPLTPTLEVSIFKDLSKVKIMAIAGDVADT